MYVNGKNTRADVNNNIGEKKILSDFLQNLLLKGCSSTNLKVLLENWHR